MDGRKLVGSGIGRMGSGGRLGWVWSLMKINNSLYIDNYSHTVFVRLRTHAGQNPWKEPGCWSRKEGTQWQCYRRQSKRRNVLFDP